jgi:phosphate transport system substrate-binding protein
MNRTTFNNIVGLTFVLGLLLSCNNKPKNGRTDTYSSGTISFYCDESFSPIIEEEVEVFELAYPAAKVKPIYTNESKSIKMLMDTMTCLSITSRRLKDSEKENLKQRSFAPIEVPFAYDGLAIITNRSNPDTMITVKDFVRILTGKVTKWSDVYPKSKLGDFDVVFDNAKSSIVHYCEDSVLGGKPITSPKISAVNKSSQVIDYVSSHKNAIGIIGSNWLNDKRDTTNVTFKKNIQVMAVSRMDKATVVNSWKPYQYYIFNKNYPLVRTLYAIINDPYHGLPWGFGQFLASPKGQLIICKSGLMPVRGEVTIRDVNVSTE